MRWFTLIYRYLSIQTEVANAAHQKLKKSLIKTTQNKKQRKTTFTYLIPSNNLEQT